MKKKKKFNKFLIRRILAILVIILLILGIRNGIYHLQNKSQTKQIRLLFNNELIKLSNHIYVENSILYLSEEDVKNIFDDTIYYNKGDQELITTYNKHVAVLHLNENQMIVNDSVVGIYGTLKEKDSKIYLPITDLGIVYDIEMEYAENNQLLIMDSTTKVKKKAMVLNDTKVKSSKLPFALNVEKIHRGDEVSIIEESGKSQKVRTISRKNWLYQNQKTFRNTSFA